MKPDQSWLFDQNDIQAEILNHLLNIFVKPTDNQIPTNLELSNTNFPIFNASSIHHLTFIPDEIEIKKNLLTVLAP